MEATGTKDYTVQAANGPALTPNGAWFTEQMAATVAKIINLMTGPNGTIPRDLASVMQPPELVAANIPHWMSNATNLMATYKQQVDTDTQSMSERDRSFLDRIVAAVQEQIELLPEKAIFSNGFAAIGRFSRMENVRDTYFKAYALGPTRELIRTLDDRDPSFINQMMAPTA